MEPKGWPEFLDLYPKKTHVDRAARAYLSIINTPDEHTKLMEGLHWHLGCRQWKEEESGKYIPNPEKFILHRLYLDRPRKADEDLPRYYRKLSKR